MSSKIIAFPSTSRPRLVVREGAAPAPQPNTVTFARPFQLPGMDEPHGPGTFEVRTSREALDVTWEAFRISTRIILTHGNSSEALDVTAADLATALALDSEQAIEAPPP